jgi:hypothetical protein
MILLGGPGSIATDGARGQGGEAHQCSLAMIVADVRACSGCEQRSDGNDVADLRSPA